MPRLQLICAFAATCLLCTVAIEDIVKDTVDALIEGAKLSEDVIDELRTAAKRVGDRMKPAEEKLLELNEKVESSSSISELAEEAFDKYYKVKKFWQSAEIKIRTLVTKTKTACHKLKDNFLDTWNNPVENGGKKRCIEEQVFT